MMKPLSQTGGLTGPGEIFGRQPTTDELRLSAEFLQQAEPASRWRQFAHVLLASNELQYVD